jgi:hypothetical protein
MQSQSRKRAMQYLLLGTAVFGYLNISAGQPQILPQRAQYIDTLETELPDVRDRIIGSYYGIPFYYGELNIARQSGEATISGNEPRRDIAMSAVDIISDAMSKYPPCMLRDICNVQLVYMTSGLERNDEKVDGLALSDGAIVLEVMHLSRLNLERITHHEIYHMCEMANVTSMQAHDELWIGIGMDSGLEPDYTGEEWYGLNHSMRIEGFPNTYSTKNPMEHRATFWEKVMIPHEKTMERISSDIAYEALYNATVQFMKEWSGGIMDEDVHAMIQRGDTVNQAYYLDRLRQECCPFIPYAQSQ